MKQLSQALAALIIIATPVLSQADDSAPRGAFSAFVDHEERPKLEWETLPGYRLFFHPKDSEPARRSLTIAVPVDDPVTSAWAIIRPASADGPYAQAWLRVEGQPAEDRVSISWDGAYLGQPFPDGAYRFEIHLLHRSGTQQHWDVQILKSLDCPRFVKLGDIEVEEHPLAFHAGQFEPVGLAATLNRSQGSVNVVARVMAPNLAEPFNTSGLLVQVRPVEDAQGKPVHAPWDCLCQQELPVDSPARLKPKKVACPWDLGALAPGLYDLRLGLYHGLKHRIEPAACDEPVLDDDRVRVRVLP
ncbi:MAG TPA: hypothetical protein VK842_00440 [bacterium]|jgi:hypothetical protein|nr:hypothetical protein [bacterium]